jgi:hypothetical protein
MNRWRLVAGASLQAILELIAIHAQHARRRRDISVRLRERPMDQLRYELVSSVTVSQLPSGNFSTTLFSLKRTVGSIGASAGLCFR